MKNKLSKKIKIVIIVKSIDGGTGTFLLNLLEIKKLFSKSSIIKTLVLERPTYRKIKNNKFSYFRDKDFYPQKYSFSSSNFVNFFSELLWIRKKLTNVKPTVILSIDLRCNLLAILTKLFFFKNIKVMITNHIDLARTIFDKSTPVVNFFLKKTIQKIYDKADVIIGVSKRLSDSLKKDFNLKNRVYTIYNGQDVHNINFRKLSSPNKYKKIITIARLFEQKDHINLIKAFSLLSKDIPKTRLLIISDGPERNSLESFVRKKKLVGKVDFLGWVDNVESYLKTADIFVLSSKREGFGYVLIEAMAQCLPIVSTDTPYGPSEILNGGEYGILVPMNDSKAFKKAIYTLLTNSKKYEYYSKKSFERSKYFSVEKMLTYYQKILTDLIK